MSSFPEILRSTRSAIFKPARQGGIYALNIRPITPSALQPQEYFSNKQKCIQGREETANAQPNHHSRNYSLTNFNRKVASCQTQRRVVKGTQKSRQSTREIKKQPLLDYGKQKLSSYAITQSAHLKVEQAQSLIHRMDECLSLAQKCDQDFFEAVKTRFETQAAIKRMYDNIEQEMQKLRQQTSLEFERLRKVLSDLRRNSLMGLKVNRLETSHIEEQFRDIRTCADALDHRGYRLYQSCLDSL